MREIAGRTMARTQHYLVCEQCERRFVSYRKESKYCSLSCYGDSMRIRAAERNRKEEILSKGYRMPVNGSLYPVEHPRVARGLMEASVAVYDVWDGQEVIVGYGKAKERRKHPWLTRKW